MHILAFETSTERGSLALLSGGEIRSVFLESGPAQSESALPLLGDLLRQAELSIARLDAIAFGSGPGAFTGLRMGCGLAQGLSLGSGVPLVGVSSLQALALQAPGEHVLVAVDARMGEVYCAAFRREGDAVEALGEPLCVPPEQLERPASGAGWLAIGGAFAAYRERIPAELLASIRIHDDQAIPRAQEIARIAAQRLAQSRITRLADAVPDYVRNKVALTTDERLRQGGRK